MSGKKGAKRLTNDQKKIIAVDYALCGNVKAIASKHNVRQSTIYAIVKRNTNYDRSIVEQLSKSMETGAGIVGNLAIEELKQKNLSKEKPRSLSAIAVDMHKIATGQPIQAVQVNVTIPNNREEILSFLQNKSANNSVIDTSATTVLSDNEIMPDK